MAAIVLLQVRAMTSRNIAASVILTNGTMHPVTLNAAEELR